MTDPDTDRPLTLLDRAQRRQAEKHLDSLSDDEQAALLAEMEAPRPGLRARIEATKAKIKATEDRGRERDKRLRDARKESKRARRPAPKTPAERMRAWRAAKKDAPPAELSKADLRLMEKKVATAARARLEALNSAIGTADRSDRRLSRITPDIAMRYVWAWTRRETLRLNLGREPSMGEIVAEAPEGMRPTRQAVHNWLRQVELLEASDVWRAFRSATV